MILKNYLLDTFHYNDYANRLVLAKLQLLHDPGACVRLFSHLINSQNKWLDRLRVYPDISQLDWWNPVYQMQELAAEWGISLQAWIDFLTSKTDADLEQEVFWIGIQNQPYKAQLKDIALQLNYHSIHHRAQIQMYIRMQGHEPDFVDYIGIKYRKV
jgi:uncharacterized damage-inducible protein DinB